MDWKDESEPLPKRIQRLEATLQSLKARLTRDERAELCSAQSRAVKRRCLPADPAPSVRKETIVIRSSSSESSGTEYETVTESVGTPRCREGTSRENNFAHDGVGQVLESTSHTCKGKDRSTEVEILHPIAPKQTKGKESRPLELTEYRRYGRQMIVPQIGLDGQISLKSARVLIIGLGGLGCPAAAYLARAGVGTIGFMDGDSVEESNLHRQILYSECSVGLNKAKNAAYECREINGNITYKIYPRDLDPHNALTLIENQYDLLLDCTDRPYTRYLISDITVLASIPLITASALKTEGQLMLLNYPPTKRRKSAEEMGFCYRCVYPKPPPRNSVQPCSEAGILGPVVGTMGTLMATEAIRVLTRPEPAKLEDSAKRLLLYSAFDETPFRKVRLKGKREGCVACSWPPKIDRESLANGLKGFEDFCSARESLNAEVPQVSAVDFAVHECRGRDHSVVVDVRNETEYGICHLPHTKNIPLRDIQTDPEVLNRVMQSVENKCQESQQAKKPGLELPTLYFICRYGNDSKIATKEAVEYVKGSGELPYIRILDVAGGLKAWRDHVDDTFPEY